uniref:Protein-PII uridylyltransferase N-terminal domain-containing protein n=1 Tax=Branchiostoma floridae TaxID=7739 RepID=C3ZJ40_BRAFL|eukprot:XP_002591458.1 hypothetical protein BRAFLDRAFT_70034 [Branchiostoma floridae]
MSDMNMTSLANKLQDLELGPKSQDRQEVRYRRALREAILDKDPFMEVEVLKSLGDLHLQKAKVHKDSAEIDKAAALYAAALLRCTVPGMGETLEHRIGYMEKLSRQLLHGYTPHFLWLSSDYWGTADSNVLRVAEICDQLDSRVSNSRQSIKDIYTEMLVTAIANSDMFLEVEVLKSLGDLYLEKGKKTSDASQFSKAAAMYNKALTRCGGPETKVTLEHRIRYMEKIREVVKKKPRPTERRPPTEHQSGNITGPESIQDQHLQKDQTRLYQENLKEGDSSLARADLDSAEQHFAASLKMVHVRDPTAQQYQREVEPLCKLGDVYSKRGQQTGDGGDFVKAAALYNAAIARSEGQVLNGNMPIAIEEVEKAFLKCILDINSNVSQDDTDKRKKQLKEMRDQIKLEMETIDQQLDPYVHDEDDPCVKEIEAKRAQAVRQLFENIAQQRKEFIRQLVEECIGLMGPPPCKYALVGLGSQATGLVTPYSDLEFAILVEVESEQYLEYFRKLTHYLHLKVVNLGETILPALGIKCLNDFNSKNPLDNWYYDSVTPRGFAFDGSMPKASKTPLGRQGTENEPSSELICTPENMVLKLQKDATVYLKKGYHLATILRNPCQIVGDQDLIDTYLGFTVKTLQADGGKMAKKMTLETLKENVKNYNDIETITGRLIDVKKEIYRFPAVAVDCLALSSGIIPTTVWETIEELENKQVISPNNAHHLTVLTSISAELRLRTYIANGGQKENLSALASMETAHIQHGQGSSLQTTDKEQRSAFNLIPVFHVQNELQLFRYYYTVYPLKIVLRELSQKGRTFHPFPDFYTKSPAVQGMMYNALCKYEQALSCGHEALKRIKDGTETETCNEKMLLLSIIGNCYNEVGDYRKGISYFEQALQMCRSVYGHGTAHADIATTLCSLGSAWSKLGNNRKAISYHEQALQMHRSIYGQNEAHHHIASSLNELGFAWHKLGDNRKSIIYYEQALQMYRSIYGQTTAHAQIGSSLSNLGIAWSHMGDHKEAINYHEQALQMLKSIYGQNTVQPDIGLTLHNLGGEWNYLGDHRKAISYFEQALQILRSIYGENTEHPDIANSLHSQGLAWSNLGNYGNAMNYYEQAFQIRRCIYGTTHPHDHIASSLDALGSTWLHLGDNRKAMNYLEQALQMYRAIYGQTHPSIATSLNNVAGGLLHLGEYKKAISYYEQALQMRRSIYSQSTAHPYIAISLINLGGALCKQGDYRKAISYLEQALQMCKSIYGQGTAHPDIARTLHNLGTAWRNLSDIRKAISYHEQALQMRRSIYGQKHPDIAISLSTLGADLIAMGDYRKAIYYYEQALQMHRSIHGQSTTHPDIASSLNALGTACFESELHSPHVCLVQTHSILVLKPAAFRNLQ